MRQFRTQYALGTNQYCKTISKAVDVLTNHTWDDTYFDNKKKKKLREKESRENKSNNTTNSNSNNDSNNNNNDKESFAQSNNNKKGEPICYCCGGNHFVTDCEKKDKVPRSEWFANKSMQMYINEESNNTNTKKGDNNNNSNSNKEQQQDDNKNTRWSGLQLFQDNDFNLDNSIILDSGSTFSSITN